MELIYKSRANRFAQLCLLLSVVIPSHAQVLQDYKCRIERVSMPGIPKQSLEFWEKLYVGKEFTVDRRSGVMVGSLKNSFITKPEIIDIGSSQNSFKAVTTMRRDQGAGVGSNVYVLIVREFEKAPRKPFLFLDNEDTFSGACEHF